MKKLLLYSFAGLALLGACKKKDTTPTYSFKNDVMPILKTSCISCHDEFNPALTADVYDSVKKDTAQIRVYIPVGTMPQTGTPLTTAQKNAIMGWLNQGAKNN